MGEEEERVRDEGLTPGRSLPLLPRLRGREEWRGAVRRRATGLSGHLGGWLAS